MPNQNDIILSSIRYHTDDVISGQTADLMMACGEEINVTAKVFTVGPTVMFSRETFLMGNEWARAHWPERTGMFTSRWDFHKVVVWQILSIDNYFSGIFMFKFEKLWFDIDEKYVRSIFGVQPQNLIDSSIFRSGMRPLSTNSTKASIRMVMSDLHK